MSYAVVWFKRDLRLHDHAALVDAAAHGPMLCLYVIEPSLWAPPDAARQHDEFFGGAVMSEVAMRLPNLLHQYAKQLAAQDSASASQPHASTLNLASFPEGFRALVIGASGGIGQAFVQVLQTHPRCGTVVGLHRHSEPRLDLDEEASIASAADALRGGENGEIGGSGKFHLIIHAAGVLHTADFSPEKKMGDLSYAQLEATFRVNTFGPALVLRHFSPLLEPQRGVLAVLSAKVGSIEDNRLGGWYSYRASKAALNMMLKTAAIEVKRSNPHAVLVSLHPGTVNTGLSKPFKGEQIGRAAPDAVADMLGVLNRLAAADSGGFFAYSGQRLPW